ncbi:MAG: LuxR C-terminal-related transcriptional regulator [Acidimicrobiales bacterium]
MSPAQHSTPALIARPIQGDLAERLSEWASLTVVRGRHGRGGAIGIAAWLQRFSPEQLKWLWVTAQGGEDLERTLHRSLQSEYGDTARTPWRIAPNAFDELEGRLLIEPADRKFVLVIDDFQEVRDEATLRTLIGLLERHQRFFVYVCSRAPHLVESLAVGVVAVNVVEFEGLLPAAGEVLDVIRAIGALLEPEWRERLRDVLPDWESTAKTVLAAADELGVRPAAVDEYLRTDVLAPIQDEGLVEQLMRLSLTEAISWDLFRDLCDDPDPDRLLASLEASELLEHVNGPDGVRFSITAAARDILREQYSTTDPEGARAFHRRLATWHAGHSDALDFVHQFHHASAGGDYELMDRLWEMHLWAMISQNAGLLSDTLEALPAEAVECRPTMQVVRELLKMAVTDSEVGHLATLRLFADTCAGLLRQHWDTMSANDLLIVATGYLIQLRLLGRFEDSAVFGDRISARARALAGTGQVARSRLAWFSVQRGITLSLLADDDGAIRSYRRAWEYGTGSGADFVQSRAAANLALTYALHGETVRARDWLDRHRSFDTGNWPGDDVNGIGGHLAAGFLALDRLDDAGVRAELAYLGDGTAQVELWPYVAYLRAQHALRSGEPHDALARLYQVVGASDIDLNKPSAAAALVARASADLLIACGQGEKAKQLIDAKGRGQRLNRVPAGRIRLLQGGADPGIFLDPSMRDPFTSTRDQLELLLIGAVAALRGDGTAGPTRLINQALDLYRETGVLRPFGTISVPDLAQLLALADGELDPSDVAILSRELPVYPCSLSLIELSTHEHAVLRALAGTGSRQMIADSLFVSVNTVKTQIASIYKKMDLRTRAEALSRARELGLLPQDAAV